MKLVMTGSIIIGTHDGGNIEVAKEVGEDLIFFFGKKVNDVTRIRKELIIYFNHKYYLEIEFK